MHFKKFHLLKRILPVLVLISLLSPAFPAGQDQERIVEKVEVTNVQVPVRVLYKGKPITDLTADDFTLYENKKKMKINGFFLKTKTLAITQKTAKATAPVVPRTFVLVFNVSNFNRYFDEAVDHLFTSILSEHDRLMIFANDKTRMYNDLKEKEQIKARVIADLKEEGKKAKIRLLNYIRRVENNIRTHDFRRKLHKNDGGQADRAIKFLQKYFLAWREYQRNYLMPRVDRFYYFSRFLEKVKGQKWVLNFYQFEFFPRIRPQSQTLNKLRDLAIEYVNSEDPSVIAVGRKLEGLLNRVMTQLVMTNIFPNDQVAKLFYKVDATFHSFFVKSTNTAFLQDIEYNEVSSNVEQILKGITDLTGGKNITSNKLVDSLETIKQVEDTYYILTYVPTNPQKAGKLKVKVNNKKYKVLYDNNFRSDYINEYFAKLESKIKTPDIKIDKFQFKKKLLNFAISGYLMKNVEGKTMGQMNVRIRVTSKDNKPLYDKTKLLTAQKKEIKVSLPTFKTIIKGEYNFLLDVKDLMTGKEDSAHQNVIIKK